LTVQIYLAQNTDADQLLSENPLALVVGMLLDQPSAIHSKKHEKAT
jgi:hypothetical protein